MTPPWEFALWANVTKGHHSWSIEEVEAFELRHPIGTKARLAFAILLLTRWASRRRRATGSAHVRDGQDQYTQAKNEHRHPIEMDIPLHPDLAAAIAAIPSGHMTFLVTEYGKPFTANGFGNAFKDWCRQANLPHCSAHGLRKATATRHSRTGRDATRNHGESPARTLEEVERYTRAARQAGLADTAMASLGHGLSLQADDKKAK